MEQIFDPSTLSSFAFVCDGEVAFIINVPPQNEHFLAVLQSNPTVVSCPNDNSVVIGDLFNDGKFIKA
jgi:hypothetical protein